MNPRTASAILAVVALASPTLLLAPVEAATPLCFGKPATIVGTAGNDVIVGTLGADVIYAGFGDDRVLGDGDTYEVSTGGADLLCGGPGRDTLLGTYGNDRINGGDGNDYANGEVGADVVQGNAGNDRLEGDFGESGHSGDGDILRGEGGADILEDNGKGQLEGGPGPDRITKWNCIGSSSIRGGTGDDYIRAFWNNYEADNCPASAPADFVYGDDGRDIAEVNEQDVVRTTEEVTRISGSVWD